MKNGALSIESEEVSFLINDEGYPTGVVKKTSKDANKLIEEFMLLANKRVALFVGKLPGDKGSNNQFIYRCHDKPAIEKLKTRSEEHTSELQSRPHLVCRLLLEKK